MSPTPWRSAARARAWLENLEELVSSAGIESELSEIVAEAELLLEPVARELVVVRPIGFEPMQWVRALAAEEPLPATKQLITAAISGPGILLAQMAAIRALIRQGLDLYGAPPVAMAGPLAGHRGLRVAAGQGHQGRRAAGDPAADRRRRLADVAPPGHGRPRRQDADGVGHQRRPGPHAPNCSRSSRTDVRTVLPPVLSIRNGRRSVVITGTPEQLGRFELYCSKITEKRRGRTQEQAPRRRGLLARSSTASRSRSASIPRGWPTPSSSSTSWAAQNAASTAELAHDFAEAIFVRPIDWVAEVEAAARVRREVDRRPGTRATPPRG